MAFLSAKDLLDLDNLKKEEIEEIIDLAIKLKAEGKLLCVRMRVSPKHDRIQVAR